MGDKDNDDMVILPEEVFIRLAGKEPIEEVDL